MEKSANVVCGGSPNASSGGLARRDAQTPMRDVEVLAQQKVHGLGGRKGASKGPASWLSPAGRPIQSLRAFRRAELFDLSFVVPEFLWYLQEGLRL